MKPAVVKGLLLALVCTSLVLQGCGALVAGGAGAAAGGGTVAYLRGESQATYPASMERTWGATLSALQDAKIKVTDTERNGDRGTITAVQADDTNVTVNLEPAGPGTTTVRIRIGVFGDEDASRAIHNRIASRLGVRRG